MNGLQESSLDPRNKTDPIKFLPRWIKSVPFFLSAMFYQSILFSIFSPAPLIVLFFHKGFFLFLLALASNSLIIFFASGGFSTAIYFVFVGLSAFFLPFFLFKLGLNADKSVFLTFIGIIVFSVLIAIIYGLIVKTNPYVDLKNTLENLIEKIITLSGTSQFGDLPPDEIKKNILSEIPSLIAVSTLVMIWVNLILMMRLLPRNVLETAGLHSQYLKSWRAPESLIWLVILCGIGLIFGKGSVVTISTNFLKFFMAIYVLQGISILTFLFDYYEIRGFFRTFLYLVVGFFMTPILAAVGFFDLWFDIRAKLRQS